jgi:ABC-2 type transport system ATP-binding protein
MDAVISVDKVDKVYKKNRILSRDTIIALKDVSFAIDKGKTIGILGPNGSGKTTLFKLMLGLCKPTKGNISIFGAHPRDIRVKHKIGFMPESPYLYNFLTADEILVFYGNLFNIDKKVLRGRINHLLKIVGMEDARHIKIGRYSKGMMQRVALASSLINDPELIFLDEPTIGLDPIGMHDMVNLIKRLKGEGKTILITSHFMYEVEQYCDRVLILYKGNLIKDAVLDDILGKKDEFRMVFKKLKDVTRSKIRDIAKSDGADILDEGNLKESIEEVFINLIKGKL